MPRIPPNGFGGFAQATPAAQMMQGFGLGRSSPGRTRKRRKAKAPSTGRKRRKGAKRGRARLVKGSAAAKAYMAKIRRKRKR